MALESLVTDKPWVISNKLPIRAAKIGLALFPNLKKTNTISRTKRKKHIQNGVSKVVFVKR